MNIESRLNKMARHHVRESQECCVMDTYQDHEDTFKAGFRAALELPEVKGLVELLQRSLEVRNFEAPEDAEVKALGERIGFGALLDSTVKGWHQSAKENGYPPGGAFTVGHCHATVESALKAFNEFCKKEGER